MRKLQKKIFVSAALSLTLRNSNCIKACDYIEDEQVKNKWRGGSRGKGGKTKWPRR